MEAKLFGRRDPEARIKREIVDFLEARGWLVILTHGNLFQAGLPDLYCAHRQHGQRWIEVKNPKAYHFTRAQQRLFPLLEAHGVGVWIIVSATDDEYQKLWRPANCHAYFGHSSR